MLQELISKSQLIVVRKAVAIPYVIALILGIIAIGILAYWFINQSGKTTSGGLQAECQAKLFTYCNQWLLKGGKPSSGSFNWDKCPPKESVNDCKNIGIEVTG